MLYYTPEKYPGLGAEERSRRSDCIPLSKCQVSKLNYFYCNWEELAWRCFVLVSQIVFMMANTIYSVISPEGCASILWKDSGRAKEAAEVLKLDAESLLKAGIIDDIIEEPEGGAHLDHARAASFMRDKIRTALEELMHYTGDYLVEHRYAKFRKIGVFMEK